MSLEKLQPPTTHKQNYKLTRSATWLENVARNAFTLFRAKLLAPRSQGFVDQEKYISLEDTLAGAKQAGMTVEDYIDNVMSGTPGATRRTLQWMAQIGVFDDPKSTVVEIGPGSGRYLAQTIAACSPQRYEIYETAVPWAKHLVTTYGVVWQ
ncbi:MAG: hypothetical protein CTY39_12590, partial [Hyphomicrobium sp.]